MKHLDFNSSHGWYSITTELGEHQVKIPRDIKNRGTVIMPDGVHLEILDLEGAMKRTLFIMVIVENDEYALEAGTIKKIKRLKK